MAEGLTAETLLTLARDGLRDIGYRDDLLREKYQFVDILAQDQPLCEIELAGFAQEPPSYRNACIGVAVLPNDDIEVIRSYRSLGAPQLLTLHLQAEKILRWKMLAHTNPVLLESIEPAHLYNAIQAHKDQWNPQRVLRAKSIRFTGEPIQLDFFDLELIPALEELVYKKLDRLLQEVLATSKVTYKEYHDVELDYQALYRLIFRLVAAKLLGDRQYPGNWLSSDVQQVMREIEHFYFQHTPPEIIIDDIHVQDIAWQKIRTAFSFQNLSVEALAYVYENTLISPETRKQYGTHATPPEIAEYIVRALPFEELAEEERHVFEPFCGHAPFLTAALGRLRELLPSNIPTQRRHNYFVQMLSGMELDTFACEVSRYSLILADYPNPDGWRIENAGVFVSPELDKYLMQARLVLCNPPYEDFSPNDRKATRSIRAANKAVEILRRVLQHPPKMLGFILPRVFADGQSYRDARKHRFYALVREYITFREEWQAEPEQAEYFEGRCRGIIRQLDAELLATYDLPTNLERELIKYFDGHRRPGPVTLTKVSPSSTKKPYRAIVRVENIKAENGSKIIEAIVSSPHSAVSPREKIEFLIERS